MSEKKGVVENVHEWFSKLGGIPDYQIGEVLNYMLKHGDLTPDEYKLELRKLKPSVRESM
ncbi:MAG: hypothetical protein QMD13_00390 [Candidatus Bathyarchaeia archaeon]|nr:hypothetical protein [Candidatus Bathyarchaeia archaeon]